MSIGPSTLGNLLVQRLDSALGISQTTQHRTGAHPDALRHTQSIQRLIHSDTSTARSTRETVDKANQQNTSRLHGRSDARLENQLQKYTDHRFTPSAPTTLGKTARTILALLTQYAYQPVQGQRPLLSAQFLHPSASSTQTTAHAGTAATTGSGLATTSPLAPHTPQTGSNPLAQLLSSLASTPSAAQQVSHTMAHALQQTVSESGLFYESKLAQLVKGLITPESLQNQPQAQTKTLSAASQSQTMSAAAKDAPATSLQQSGIDPSTQQLVRQQLEVLANQTFNWRGEAWPGVPMDLEIQRRREDEDEQATNTLHDEDDTPWQSRLKLELPTLGTVQARLHIHNQTVRIQIEAPNASETLKQHLAPLVDRLEAQGIAIQQLHVLREDPLYATPDDYSHAYD
ncbi:flagellar hook-length control protein FliK [Paenalcaligenes hominis]|uniref:flagellar hook-length control protein FliK n=1 Tax=Paenalcaligenes hominis TaxID=643674 RepID=UPI00352657E2